MDFKNGQELLHFCHTENVPISEIMIRREIALGTASRGEVISKMKNTLQVMRNSVKSALEHPQPSISGLLGGEAKKVSEYSAQNACAGAALMNKMIAYSMAVLEVNASMGIIAAAPTAGSSGVIPAVLTAFQEEYALSDETVLNGLFNAAAIGYLLMRNASVAGAEAGCQAEVGAASAMAAGAVTEMLGGTPQMCLSAASMALSNLLGLVCDPVAGLVEVPCQSRNVVGAQNAASCAQIALSGVPFLIPFDEMAETMYRVGRSIPFELRETAIGGCAGTQTGQTFSCAGTGNGAPFPCAGCGNS